MYTVWVRLEVREEKLNEFIDGIHTNSRATLEDEPGCIRFDVQRSLTEPNTFYFYEIYTSREAFEVEHRSAAHYARWQRVVAECVVPGTQMNTYAEPLFPGEIPEWQERAR